MVVKVAKSKLNGNLVAPISKSAAHRALICAALADEPCTLYGKFVGDDIDATIIAVCSLGAKVSKGVDCVVVEPSKKRAKKIEIDANESGSTLRFMLPVVTALGIETKFVGRGQLVSRPISELLTVLSKKGVYTDSMVLPLTMSGQLKGGLFEIDGSISSQYISGLLFALPLLENDSKIVVSKEVVSSGYIDLTMDILSDFSIAIERKDNTFLIKGNQRYQSPKHYKVEGDFSSAAFFAVGGAINGQISIEGLRMNSLQSDRAVVDILLQMGANLEVFQSGFSVSYSNLKPVEVNIENCPDLAPILSIAMATACGDSKMFGVDRLRIKESDRLQGVINMLKTFGIESSNSCDCLTIYGGALKGGGTINSQCDHRFAMSGAIGASRVGASVTDFDCVNKSYPMFWQDFVALGGKYES